MAAAPAVALFVERAQAVRPEFQLTVHNANDVAAICRRLENGPYQAVLSADAYTQVSEASDHGYPLLEHIRRLVSDEIIWAPAIDGAVVRSTRGGDFALHLGQDVSIGYTRPRSQSNPVHARNPAHLGR